MAPDDRPEGTPAESQDHPDRVVLILGETGSRASRSLYALLTTAGRFRQFDDTIIYYGSAALERIDGCIDPGLDVIVCFIPKSKAKDQLAALKHERGKWRTLKYSAFRRLSQTGVQLGLTFWHPWAAAALWYVWHHLPEILKILALVASGLAIFDSTGVVRLLKQLFGRHGSVVRSHSRTPGGLRHQLPFTQGRYAPASA